ncbi:hypothetical protein [Pseudomonas nicosulfuronedens]
MKDSNNSLLVVKVCHPLSEESRRKIKQHFLSIAESLKTELVVCDDRMEVTIQSDMKPLMESMLKEQQKTNLLLASLIEAMADEDDMAERPQRTYLNGEPIL